MMVIMVPTIALLYSNPPSSRSMEERNVMRMWCLRGNFTHTERMASTTMVLNSSDISDMKLLICFMSRSTLASLPVWGREGGREKIIPGHTFEKLNRTVIERSIICTLTYTVEPLNNGQVGDPLFRGCPFFGGRQ